MTSEYTDKEVLEFAKTGNVQAILNLGRMRAGLYKECICVAAQHGHVNILQQCITNEGWKINPWLCFLVWRFAAKHAQLDVLRFMMKYRSILPPNMREPLYMTRVESDQIKLVEWWITEGWVHDDEQLKERFRFEAFRFAMWNGRHEVLKWLLEQGVKYKISGLRYNHLTTENKLKTIQVLHEYGVNVDCESGRCLVCKMEKVWNAWMLDSYTFTHSVQWLPMEVLGDVLDLSV